MATTVGYVGGRFIRRRSPKMRAVVICPKCLTATAEGQFERSPDREGKPCWRCPGTYVLVQVPTGPPTIENPVA